MTDQPTTGRTIPVENTAEETELLLKQTQAVLKSVIAERDEWQEQCERYTEKMRQLRAEIASQPLSFKDLREANLIRCKESFHYSPDEWSSERWMLAMGGELGETLEAVLKMVMSGTLAMNSLKKVIRGDGDVAQVRKEVADVIIYGDFVLLSIGATMDQAVVEKFNETSEKVGSKVFLPNESDTIIESRYSIDRLPD